MLALLLAATASQPLALTPGRFDLAEIAAPVRADDRRELAARYLLPDIDEPGEDAEGIRVKLKWRRVRVTVPLDGLQPPF